jgi:hypothetical protein
MRVLGGLVTLIVVLAVGYYLYWGPSGGGGAKSAVRQIDRVGLRSDLLALAQAERLHAASHGGYATLEELAASGAIPFDPHKRRGYRFEAILDTPGRFRIVARPVEKEGPTLSIDETLQILEP